MQQHGENIRPGEQQPTQFASVRNGPDAGRAETTNGNFGPLALVAPVLFLVKEVTERHSFDAIPWFLVFEFLLLLQLVSLIRRQSPCISGALEFVFQPFKAKVGD